MVEPGGTASYYHADGPRSVRAITDQQGRVVHAYRTDEFGFPTPRQGSQDQPFQYTGEPRDEPTGFSYLRARYYDPQVGRFLTRDPVAGSRGKPKSLNRYSYVGNNPTTLTDPSGLCVDPGGPGIRYCIDRFIPQQFIAGGEGDNRGADDGSRNPDNTFRIRQLIFREDNGSLGYIQEAGVSRGLGQEAPGRLERCGVAVTKSQVLQARRIVARCQGSNGLIPTNLGPAIKTEVVIQETPGNLQVVAAGTPYPFLEVWQYSDSGSSLIFFFDAEAAGTNPVIDLLYEVLLPNYAP
jgi:RHS repeat-associated protein